MLRRHEAGQIDLKKKVSFEIAIDKRSPLTKCWLYPKPFALTTTSLLQYLRLLINSSFFKFPEVLMNLRRPRQLVSRYRTQNESFFSIANPTDLTKTAWRKMWHSLAEIARFFYGLLKASGSVEDDTEVIIIRDGSVKEFLGGG